MKNSRVVVNPKSSFNTPPKTVDQKGKEFFDGLRKEQFHFFASSVFDWALTSDKRDLAGLIDIMTRFGNDFTVWMVPCSHDAHYNIEWYAPQVQGSKIVGRFVVPQKKRATKKVKTTV